MIVEKTAKSDGGTLIARLGFRLVLAILITGLVIDYTAGVVSGVIPDGHKIDGIHLAIIVLGVMVAVLLVRPESFERLKLLELSGFRLEMLERVQEKQAKQET